MSVLAAIVEELDAETFRTKNELSEDNYNLWVSQYEELSSALALFNHNVLVYKLLNIEKQVFYY